MVVNGLSTWIAPAGRSRLVPGRIEAWFVTGWLHGSPAGRSRLVPGHIEAWSCSIYVDRPQVAPGERAGPH